MNVVASAIRAIVQGSSQRATISVVANDRIWTTPRDQTIQNIDLATRSFTQVYAELPARSDSWLGRPARPSAASQTCL